MFRKTSHTAEQLHQMSWSKNRITTHFTDSVYLWGGGKNLSQTFIRNYGLDDSDRYERTEQNRF